MHDAYHEATRHIMASSLWKIVSCNACSCTSFFFREFFNVFFSFNWCISNGQPTTHRRQWTGVHERYVHCRLTRVYCICTKRHVYSKPTYIDLNYDTTASLNDVKNYKYCSSRQFISVWSNQLRFLKEGTFAYTATKSRPLGKLKNELREKST